MLQGIVHQPIGKMGNFRFGKMVALLFTLLGKTQARTLVGQANACQAKPNGKTPRAELMEENIHGGINPQTSVIATLVRMLVKRHQWTGIQRKVIVPMV